MAYAEKRGKGDYPWRVKFKKPDGKEDSASGFRTKQDALNHGRDQEANVRAGRYYDPNRGAITLAELYAKWLAVQTIADRTISARNSQFNAHLKPRWGDTPIRDIDPFDVRAFRKDLYATWAKSTADGVMELLRMMLSDAVEANYIPATPVPPTERRGTRGPSKVRIGQVVDLKTVLAIGARMPEPLELMLVFMLFTGMRWGEAIGVRRSFLTLRAAAGAEAAQGFYVIDPDIGAVHEDAADKRFFAWPKGRKGRTVELPPFLVELLLAYLDTVPADRDLLWVNGKGEALNRSKFDLSWRPFCNGWSGRKLVRGHFVCDGAPLAPDLVPHDLRHTHKTWLADDGVQAVARDERLGHKTPGMDGVYIHPTPAMRAQILVCLQRRWENRAQS